MFDGLHSLLTPRIIIQFINNLIHQSAYIAEHAIRHQHRIQLHINKPHLVYPNTSVLDGTPTDTHRELFTCYYVKHIWTHTNYLIDQLQGTMKVSSLHDLYKCIIQINDRKFTSIKDALKEHININLIMLTIKTIWDTYIYKMKLHQDTDNHIITKTLKHLNKTYNVQLNYEISSIFSHRHTIQKQSRSRFDTPAPRIDARQKVTWPHCHDHKWKFNNRLLDIINDTWLKTYLVTVEPFNTTHSKLLITSPTLLTPWPP